MNGSFELCSLITAKAQNLVAVSQLSTQGLDSHTLIGVLARGIEPKDDHSFSFFHVFNHSVIH